MDPILIIEDKADVRMAATIALGNHGFHTVEAETPAVATELLEQQGFALVLLDMNFSDDTTSGKEGLDFLAKMRRRQLTTPVIVMTAWASVDLAVQAMQFGACDFIEKPWNNTRLINVVKQQIEKTQLEESNARLDAASKLLPEQPVLAHSDVMQRLLNQAKRAALSDVSILITGENGTGKSMLAQFIHQHSNRADNILVSVNMGAIPESLFESELFGHKKGAFTDAKEDRLGRFDIANGGTLFLDEVGTIPIALQSKLLRVLESQTFEMIGSSQTKATDVRVISATNTDLQQAIDSGEFRQDLLFRLNTIELCIPPLRERTEDIEPLAKQFLKQLGNKYHRAQMYLSESAIKALKAYSWPGNVRELSHCIERAMILSDSDEITPEQLNLAPQSTSAKQEQELPLMTLDEAERRLLVNAIKSFDGNVIAAGEFLGLTKSTIYRRLEKHDIDPKQIF